MNAKLPDLSTIQQAILNAPELPKGFPFPSLQDADTLAAIRTNPTLRAFLDAVRIETERAQSTPTAPLSFSLFQLFETTGDRSSYQDAYFDRRRRLSAVALATILDETPIYQATLHDLLWQICNEYTWALPAHLPVGIENIKTHALPPEQIVDLFAAETAHTLAELLHILGDRLDGWLHYRIRTEIEHRVFHPIFNIGHRFAWETAQMNWAAVCGGSVGMAALLLENNRERLVKMIDRMIRTMECFLSGFGADGACPEGINYWVYGFGYFTYFADMLYAYTDGALDLLQHDQIQRIVAFPEAANLGKGNFINYSDASAKAAIPPGLGSYLCKKSGQTIPGLTLPDFHADPVYRWGHIVRDLLWTDLGCLDHAPRMGVVYLDHVNWLIAKDTLNGQTIVFSAKGGNNDEPHNHNDLGHFILNIGGESLFADLGAGVYTKQYFGEERYNSLHTGSQGHSVPIINGKYQSAGSEKTATVLNYQNLPDKLMFELDLTRAYDDPTQNAFRRSFEWQVMPTENLATLTLIDTFDFSRKATSLVERFISLSPPSIKNGAIEWSGEFGNVRLTYSATNFDASAERIQIVNHDLEPMIVYQINLTAHKSKTSYQAIFAITINVG